MVIRQSGRFGHQQRLLQAFTDDVFIFSLLVYSASQTSNPPPQLFFNIFIQVKYISVKFCQYVASLYLHIHTNFDRFVLIFNKMALIFLGVPIVFNVSSFKFH